MPLHQITKNQKIYIEYAPHHLGAKKTNDEYFGDKFLPPTNYKM